jgi:hypothetical protein
VESLQNLLLKGGRTIQPDAIMEVKDANLKREFVFGIGCDLELVDPLCSMLIVRVAVTNILQPSRLAFRDSYE